jgi:hypothetical protein
MGRVRLEDKAITYVPKDQYEPELEAEVEKFLRISPVLPQNKVLHKRVAIPTFKSPTAKAAWEREEIDRCKYGHNGMTGKMYFFFNYGFIQNLSGGKIAPDFRVADDEWFKLVQECQDSREWGIVCVKRRRVGMSWKESADVLHDTLFTPFYQVGMNSKSEKDSYLLFLKVKFMYDNLPPFLRIKASSKTKSTLDFSFFVKDELGNKIKKGTQSKITVVAPTDSAFEGWMLGKWVCDEAGKIVNLPQMWSYTEDCLMEETIRVGFPILFGTSGDIGKDGKGLKKMWDNAEIHKLKRFFFAGWMGLGADKYGNDNREELIRWIVYQRHLRKGLSSKMYADFLQRYPLTIKEAFAQASTGGVGDLVKIHNQVDSLKENPVRAVQGRFALNAAGDVVYKPDDKSPGRLYEYAKTGIDRLYVAGSDPADHDDADETASDLSTYIMRKEYGMDVPRIVFEYTDRPKYLDDYYDQTILALMYYNNCKILIERNRYRMIQYFEAAGQKQLLRSAPQGIMRLTRGRSDVIGVNMTAALKEYGEALIEEYIRDYSEHIPSVKLLEEFPKYGADNTDRVMAFMITLLQLKEDRMNARKGVKDGKNPLLPRFKYVNRNGVITRVSQ